jgi:ribosomal subunit interface protein
MDLRITGNNVSISEALKSYTERSLRTCLANTDRRVQEVEVRVADVNGPKGGVDKLCGIRVVLRRAGIVFVEARGADAYGTVDKAAARLRAAVARRVGRHRSRLRRAAYASIEAPA